MQVDDAFDLGGSGGGARGKRIEDRRYGRGLGSEQRFQSDGADTELAGSAQEMTARLVLKLMKMWIHGGVGAEMTQRFIKVSSRLSRTLATVVQAASSTGSASGGRGPTGWVAISAALVGSCR